MDGCVIIGYDGTDEAKRAVDFAARTLQITSAVVVYVWSDGPAVTAVGPVGTVPVVLPQQQQEIEDAARAVAAGGAARARAVGLDAAAAVRYGVGSSDVARVLHDVADEYAAELIVVGRRPSSLLENALRGSVSGAALRHERQPVLVVPGGISGR